MVKKYKYEIFDESFLDGRDYFSIGYIEVNKWKYFLEWLKGKTVRKTKL